MTGLSLSTWESYLLSWLKGTFLSEAAATGCWGYFGLLRMLFYTSKSKLMENVSKVWAMNF